MHDIHFVAFSLSVNQLISKRDEEGKVSTVCYEVVNAMLLNEFIKEHRKVQELETTVAQQQKQIDALATGLQKVSAKVETRNPARKIAANGR